MKIEIELAEVERLRERIKHLEERESELEKQIEGAAIPQLRKKAVSLSKRLFSEYMDATLKSFGWKGGGWSGNAVEFEDWIESRLGDEWYSRDDRVSFTICANVSAAWKGALLSIGVIPDSELKEKILEL
jgi:hypothetical protein